ncbi:MAG TPA: ABC transporter ATP-binding protein [Firmicutes bacterium]|nr:ABC transporter ATP-binding protein [Bacillota bacterium]
MLAIQNLCKTFNEDTVNEKIVFKGLNLTVNEGEFVCVVGSNGAGKSTLFQMLTGAILPDDGSITLFDDDLTQCPDYLRSKWMGTVYQDPKVGTAPSLTIKQNLALACSKGKGFGLSFLEHKRQVETFKSLVAPLGLGLEEMMDTKVELLSGGQRQALALLMATLVTPKLLLLDEHTAALDPKTSQKIMELTATLIEKHHMTSLMITHNLHHALTYGNRLIMLHQGRIVLDIMGAEKNTLTKEALLLRFDNSVNESLIDDELLLS